MIKRQSGKEVLKKKKKKLPSVMMKKQSVTEKTENMYYCYRQKTHKMLHNSTTLSYSTVHQSSYQDSELLLLLINKIKQQDEYYIKNIIKSF